MRKNFSPLLYLLFALLVFTSLVHAQQPAPATGQKPVSNEQLPDDAIQLMRQDIRSQRKQLVAANMPLTDVEATKFWPVYDSYVAEVTKLGDTRVAIIKEYAQNYDTLSDAQANSLINRWLTNDQSAAQLRLKWVPAFEKVISPKKTAMFFQIDRRLGLLIDLQLASQIPLAKP